WARRADERAGGRPRWPNAGGGGRADPGVAARARSARAAGVVPAHRRALRALPVADRAVDLAPVVVLDGRAEGARARGAARAARPLPPRVAAPVRDRLARARARLEHLAPALVGAPASG